MSQIASLDVSGGQAAQASASGAEAGGTSAAQDAVAGLGLPPASLAAAASANTVNAQLATSQWGVDPNSVAGVYGGAAQSAGNFAGANLLPLLQSLSPATAEQALTLLGVATPRPGAAATTNAAAAAQAAAAANSGTLFGQESGASGPMVVDPLWGRSA